MKSKTQEFLSTRKKIQPLNDIVKEFEVSFFFFSLSQMDPIENMDFSRSNQFIEVMLWLKFTWCHFI